MEIIGDDKKLRALFSEVRIADEAATPSFTSAWHRAQARSLKPRRVFQFSFAAVTALLVLTFASLAVWSVYSNRSAARYAAVAELKMITAQVAPKDKIAVDEPAPVVDKPVQRLSRRHVTRAIGQNETLAKNETTTIDGWQSPTAALLTSATDELFKSVPQLNENANRSEERRV